MSSFSIGSNSRERIEVQVVGYKRNPVGEYFDDNWLRVRVLVVSGAFSGKYDAAFLTEELVSFHNQLIELYRSLNGIAKFSTMEEQLSLLLHGNGRGEILLKGTAIDIPGTGNRLVFELTLDQTQLQKTLAELSLVTESFPVRAS
ncbi:MAG: hypothetical protein V4568_01710 [Pseudomonadota bacterium]